MLGLAVLACWYGASDVAARDAEQAHALPCRTPATTQLPLYNSQFHIQDLAPRTQRVPAVVYGTCTGKYMSPGRQSPSL